MQDPRYRSRHRLDPRGFAMALAVERGSVYWSEGVVAIALQRKGDRSGEVVLVSFKDRHLGRFYWSHSRWGYPRRRDRTGKGVLMHREIMGLALGDPRHVDHINRDRFDNRRENLRFVNQLENSQNQGSRGRTSSHRGVSFRTRDAKWVVNHKIGGKHYYSGAFDTEEEAVAVARAFRVQHMPFAMD